MRENHNPAHPLVDLLAGQVPIDPSLTDRLEAGRPEVAGWSRAVKAAERLQCELDVIQLAGRPVALKVIPPGERPVPEEQLGDGQVALPGRRGRGQPAAVGEPFRDEAVILGLALGRAVAAEIDVPAVEPNPGLAAGTMQAVAGRAVGETGHGGRTSPESQTGRLPVWLRG